MAKSIRSKRGKKMRAIKRVRYTQKQLKQLKETVSKSIIHAIESSTDSSPVRVKIADYVELKKRQVTEKLQKEPNKETMNEADVVVFSKKTMKDQTGEYPKWMGQKQIWKHKRRNDKSRKSNGRKKGW
ncbi:protein LLP-like [Tropilaelaps mercedesae]|uniref:Protein LLP-like n=1 Tax=Tropilaelaps mercedesae TaxID=418985 RepID=A0A1V9X3L0_9ACAR|nr:protein LLP-like [Tropilaelaps mercedesae]